MTLFDGVIVYILAWWVTLFAVLPLWVKPADPGDPGHDSGAPQHPHLWRKAGVTTAIAAVVWLVVFALMNSPWLSLGGR